MQYMVVIEKMETSYRAFVPDLPDCTAVGETEAETMTLIQEVILFHLKGLQENGFLFPVPASKSTFVQVPFTDSYPDYFYKYRAVSNTQNPLEDWSLKALFSSRAVFSTRTSFNDLFDSKIQLIKPTREQLRRIRKYSETSGGQLREMFAGDSLTKHGQNFLEKLEQEFNKLIDDYYFYCVSANSSSNLMWSHYADSHRGFCIEYRSTQLAAERVYYQKELSRLDLCELIPPYSKGIEDHNHVGHKIWRALRHKLEDWSYEEEYRVKLNKNMPSTDVQHAGNNKLVSYDATFVESIIFGVRMPDYIKSLIADNMPYSTKFKQAIISGSSIKIIESKLQR